VYIEGKKRAPDYRNFLAFMAKIRSLVGCADEHGTLRVFSTQ
jgi:hypothetical protein